MSKSELFAGVPGFRSSGLDVSPSSTMMRPCSGPVVTRRMVLQPLLLVLEPAGHRPATPVMPAARITRATRLRPTATPHATSSA